MMVNIGQRLLKKLSLGFRAILLLLVGTVVWSLTMVKSGIAYSYGMGFWGPNGHDGVWHIALIESLARGNYAMPIFAGETIKNYHIGFDLFVAVLHKLTFMPVSTLYFQILPPAFALLVGYFAYKFVFLWTQDPAKAYWATFFVYFGGSFGWVITLFRSNEVGGESIFWSQQSISTLVNPPFAFSLLLFFAGLHFLVRGVRGKTKRDLLLAAFLFGVLVQIKVYAGILVLAGLLVSGFWRLVTRKGSDLVKVFTATVVIAILLFPKVDNAGLIFRPFWFLEEMMSTPDRVYWPKFAQALANYKLAGNWLKAIAAYSLAFVIFIVGNFAMRLVGIYHFLKRGFKRLDYVGVFFAVVVLAGIGAPLFYTQRGTAWNTIQFMYYSLMCAGVLAGVSVVNIARSYKFGKIVNVVTGFALVLLVLPTTVGALKHYLPARPPAMISSQELDALQFLAAQPEGVVLTQPFDKDAAAAAVNSPPRPLYLYESTAYVSAFAKKPVYLEDEVNLDITGYDWQSRRDKVERILSEPLDSESMQFFQNTNISYLYVVRSKGIPIGVENSLTKVFENSEVIIYSNL